MNASEIAVLAKATQDGSMPFPEIVGRLIANGVEYYHVDYATGSFTFYSASGAAVLAPISFEKLPSISEAFDATALKAAIVDSQQHGQKFRAFASVPCRLVCRDTSLIFEASESPISVVKGTSTRSGFPAQDRTTPDVRFRCWPSCRQQVAADERSSVGAQTLPDRVA